MFLGFAGGSFKLDEQVLLKQGQAAKVGQWEFRNDGIKVSDDGQKQMTTAYIAVLEGGKQIDLPLSGTVGLPSARGFADHGSRHPARLLAGPLPRAAGHRSRHDGGPDGNPADRRQPARELDLAWLRRHRVRHGHRPAARARLLVCRRRRADPTSRARRRRCCSSSSSHRRRSLRRCTIRALRTRRSGRASELEKQMRREMVCICGDCAHYPLSECTCSVAAEDARRTGGADRAGQEPRPGSPVGGGALRQPGAARRAARPGLQQTRVAAAVVVWCGRGGRSWLRRDPLVQESPDGGAGHRWLPPIPN